MTDYLIAALFFDALSFLLFMRVYRGDPKFRFARHLYFSIPFCIAGIYFSVMGSVTTIGLGDRFSTLATMGLLTSLCLPLCFLPLCTFSEWLGNLLSLGGAESIRALRTCGKAVHAEREGEFDLAEKYFKESMPKDISKPASEFAPIHLQYGEFLRKRERFAEAAVQWKLAIRDGIDAEKR